MKSWLNDSASDAEVVLSVCNGAFILARAGLIKEPENVVAVARAHEN